MYSSHFSRFVKIRNSVLCDTFQVFSLTVVFGLFHGLVLFPVILSVLGPVDDSESLDSGVSTPTISFASDVSNSTASSHASSPEKGKKNRAFESEV